MNHPDEPRKAPSNLIEIESIVAKMDHPADIPGFPQTGHPA
jgi:hypothetical protein